MNGRHGHIYEMGGIHTVICQERDFPPYHPIKSYGGGFYPVWKAWPCLPRHGNFSCSSRRSSIVVWAIPVTLIFKILGVQQFISSSGGLGGVSSLNDNLLLCLLAIFKLLDEDELFLTWVFGIDLGIRVRVKWLLIEGSCK